MIIQNIVSPVIIQYRPALHISIDKCAADPYHKKIKNIKMGSIDFFNLNIS